MYTENGDVGSLTRVGEYHWRKLPQVSFLSRQTRFLSVVCLSRQNIFDTTNICRVLTVTSDLNRFPWWVPIRNINRCHNKRYCPLSWFSTWQWSRQTYYLVTCVLSWCKTTTTITNKQTIKNHEWMCDSSWGEPIQLKSKNKVINWWSEFLLSQ